MERNLDYYFNLNNQNDKNYKNDKQDSNHKINNDKIKIDKIKNDKYLLRFDGACRGNPGKSSAGAVLYKNNEEIWTKSMYLGDNFTNNIAEYFSLLLGLEEVVNRHILHLDVQGDSLLVINQINGKWKVKNENLKKLYQKAKHFEKKFNYITFTHIYREGNKRADELANQALDNL